MPCEFVQLPNRFRNFVFPVVAITYFLAAELGHALSFPGDFATFWPAAGIALAAYLYVPTNGWILVLLGTMAGNLISDLLLHDKSVFVSFAFWVSNTCESIVSVCLVRWLHKDRVFSWTARSVISFVALPCLVGTAFGATFGAGVVSAAFGASYSETWPIWWSGDFIGMLVVFPFAWICAEAVSPKAGARVREDLRNPLKIAELIALILMVGAGSAYIFGYQNQRLAYAVYPVLLALSVRFTMAGATSGLLVLALVTVSYTSAGQGLFGEIEDIAKRAGVLQIYLFVASSTFLTLAASIRERAFAQESQQEAKRMLVSATRGGNVGLWDWDIASGRVKWSDQCHYQLGMPLGTLSSFEDWEQRVHPDDLAESLSQVTNSLSSANGNYESTFRLRHSDGGHRWILSRGRVDFDPQGKPFRMSGTHTDITELKATRDQLESYLRLIGTTDGGWNWDLETDKVEYTPRFLELLGVQPDSTEDHPLPKNIKGFRDRVHPDDRPNWWRVMAEQLESDSPFESEFRLRLEDRSWRWFRGRGRVLRDEDSKPVRMAGSIYDITDRKQVELELTNSNADLAQFAYVASHDLQEPLRAVIGFCQLLEERMSESLDEKGNSYVRNIVDGSQRMKELIDDLLEFSRVSQGDRKTEETDLNKVAEAATRSLATLITEQNAQVKIDNLPTVIGHAGMLTQLFQNLIGNGIKFHQANKPPKIHVTSSKLGDEVEIRFNDNGIGIPTEHQDQVFVMFERLHHRRDYPGTGIGLAICKRIVDRHKGDLRIESENGEGSTFIVSLPATLFAADEGLQD